jgi:hypothetical protein
LGAPAMELLPDLDLAQPDFGPQSLQRQVDEIAL